MLKFVVLSLTAALMFGLTIMAQAADFPNTGEWAKGEGIYGVNGVQKTSPDATAVAHDVFHYDNSAKGSGPQTATFEIDLAEDFGDRDVWCDVQEFLDDVYVGLSIDDSFWTVNHGGTVSPEFGWNTTFTPDDTVRDDIQISLTVVDVDPSQSAGNSGDADDEDVTVSYASNLTTFKVGMRLQSHAAATFDFWEDDDNYTERYFTIEADLTGQLEADSSTSVLSVVDAALAKSTKVENESPKWTAIAGSAGPDYLVQIRGLITSTLGYEASGTLDLSFRADVDSSNGSSSEVNLNLIGTAANFVPGGGGTYISAAISVIEPLLRNNTAVSGGTSGRVCILGVGTQSLNSMYDGIQTKTVTGHGEFMEITVADFVRTIDLAGLSKTGEVSLKPGDELLSSYAIQSFVQCDDDSPFVSTRGDIEEDDGGVLKSYTLRPIFEEEE